MISPSISDDLLHVSNSSTTGKVGVLIASIGYADKETAHLLAVCQVGAFATES
jgi:hypothetical protein